MEIRSKSSWQKRDCLFCKEDSTLEVVDEREGLYVRCCLNHVDKAKQFVDDFNDVNVLLKLRKVKGIS